MDRTRRIPLLLAFVVALLALGGPASQAAPAKKPAPQSVPGEVLVGFRSDVSDAEQKSLLKQVGASEERSFKKIHASLLRVSPAATDTTLAKLRADARVRYAEPNFVVHADAVPNDPAFANLWGLNNSGQPIQGVPGTPDADIDAAEAWDTTTGSANVTVAVIDTGVDWSHPDLSSQIWTNPGENCSGCRTDGVDNDHNGYVDDWRGWDFANHDNNPMDDHGHGTHVAGTIGAAGNNGVGVAGVNWNVRIMPLKFLNAQGSGTNADAISAVLYAAQNGADVLSNSWAGGPYSQALADAITVADQHNSLFVAAAGNNGTNNDTTPTYPASYDLPNVVAVAATDNTDGLAYFSNTGKRSVDLGAPGVNVYSTWPGASYQYLSGTSMATPHVSGAAALAKAAFPSASAVGLKALLLGTADPKASLANTTAGGGRLNVGNAVACNGVPQIWVDSPSSGFLVDVGASVSFSFIATNCASPAGVSVSATANGAAVAVTPRGDGLYIGTFTAPTRGGVTFAVTATSGARTATRSVTGTATQAYSIVPGGAPLTLTTTTPGESPQVRFNGGAGENVSLALTNVTFSAAQISIVGPSGSTVATTYAGTAGGFVDTRTLPATGAYTIAITPFGSVTGSITLTLYDVPPDAGGTIAPGGTSTISVTTPGQNGRVTFTGAANERVSVQFTGVTLNLALVSILKPDGTSLGSNRYLGTSGAFIDATVLPAAGTYSIAIDPQSAATGAATMTLYDVPPDAGGAVTPGGPGVTAGTTAPGQNVRVTFTGTAGERISATITGSTFSYATASLIGPDGNAVGGSTFFGAGFDAFMDVRALPANGTYALVVDPPGTTIGTATFNVFDVPPDVTGSIAPGGPSVPVSMTSPGQNAKLTFAGTAGQRVSLNVGPSSLAQAYVSITNPDGSSLVGNTLFSTGGTFVDARTLPATGTYTLTVDPQGTGTGVAVLKLYDVPPDASGLLALGTPQTVTISAPGQNARLTFAGHAGQALTLKLSAVTISFGYVSIVKADGSSVVSNQIFGPFDRTISTTLPADATYTVVVDPQGSATGSATLALT